MSTLSESEIWRIIEGMNWIIECNNYRGYYTMKEKFMKKYSRDESIQVRKFVSQKHNALYKVVDEYESDNGSLGNYGGDDSFGDLLDHAIGLGEAFYAAVMEKPELLAKLNYVENFCYALPYEDDYDS